MAIMGVDALKANLTNPQRSFLFDVLIPQPVGPGDFTTLQVRARSSQVPERSNEMIAVPFKQTVGLVYSGKDHISHEWTCTFIEGEDQAIWQAMSGWQQQIIDTQSGIGTGEPNYYTDVYLNMVSVAGQPTMNLKLKNAWVRSLGQVALDQSANTMVTYTVVFAYDYFIDQNAQ